MLYIYIYIYIYTYIYIYNIIYIYVCIYKWPCRFMYVYNYIKTHTYTCPHAHTNTHTHTHTHTRKHQHVLVLLECLYTWLSRILQTCLCLRRSIFVHGPGLQGAEQVGPPLGSSYQGYVFVNASQSCSNREFQYVCLARLGISGFGLGLASVFGGRVWFRMDRRPFESPSSDF